jgi:hypothetical protein
MGYQQQPCDQFPCAQQQQQQQQQQQPFLPPWYRTGGVQQPLAQQAGPSGSGQHNSSARPPQPQSIYGAPYGSYHGSWGGKSNSSFSNAPADGQGWRSRNPSSYQRPSAPGRGNGSSYGSSYNSGYSSPGRGYGSSYGGPDRGYGGGKGRGRGSPSPQRAPSPPVWLKDDCWLVPKPGTVEAAAHAAAVARHRQQQQQQPPNTAVAAGVVAATAHSVAVVASAADVDVVDLTGEDHSSRAGSQAAAAAAAATAAGPLSPSKAEVIDLTGKPIKPVLTAVWLLLQPAGTGTKVRQRVWLVRPGCHPRSPRAKPHRPVNVFMLPDLSCSHDLMWSLSRIVSLKMATRGPCSADLLLRGVCASR